MPEIIHNRLPLSCARRRGVVLLMVLLMVMAITIAALGFMARADSELSCGENMSVRVQMDQLAQSGLEHAKGLAVRPPYELQGCSSFSLVEQQLLVTQSSDFYDVDVVQNGSDACTYDITSEAYRRQGTERTGMSRLAAQLRLDPCLALWTGSDIGIAAGWGIHGDLYAAGSVVNLGLPANLDGDVFSSGPAPGAVGAHKVPGELLALLAWPPVNATYFEPEYTVSPVGPGTLPNSTALTSPWHIWRCDGDLTIGHNTRIEGMLLVTGNLTVTGAGSRIIASKNVPALSTSTVGNVPALYVGGNLVFRTASNVQITGLVVVDGHVLIGADTSGLSIRGALFAQQMMAEAAVDSSGSGSHALLRNGPGWGSVGGRQAIQLDGADDYLQTLDSATRLQLVDQYTLSLWVQPAAMQKNWAALLCKADASGTPPANHWTLQLDQSATTLMVYHGNASCWDTGIGLDEMADGFWHHVALVRQADGTMISYFDNVPRKTLDPSDPMQLSFQNMPPGNGNGHLNIGADRTTSSDYLYQGLLGDIRIYGSALGPTDIDKLYNMKALTAISLGHWSLAETGSSMVVTADPAVAAIVVGPPENNEYWSSAGGGFFRNIRRE